MKPKRGVLITIGLVLTLGASWPLSYSYRHARSQQLIAEADRAVGKSAIAKLETARFLDPGHPQAYLELARLYFRAGRVDHASRVIARLPKGGRDTAQALVIKSQIELELGKLAEATAAAKRAYQLDGRSEAAITQLGLCYATGGEEGSLKELISSSQATPAHSTLLKIGGGTTPLAQHMFDRGLLRSSRRVLERGEDSGAKYLLLARITLQLRDEKEWLNKAKNYAEKGSLIDPGSLELHRLLHDIYQRQGDQKSAEREARLIDELTTQN